MKNCPTLLSFVLAWLGLGAAMPRTEAQVVINEIFYHAPDDLAALQWVEFHNTSDQAVDVSGWRLTKGGKFTFAAGTTIAAHGYLVVCQNRAAFAAAYSVPVAGEFEKALKTGGGKLDLVDRTGRVVDRVEFDDRPPWPVAADGQTASLERICPTAPGNLVENWTGSPLGPDSTRAGGTPGEKNAAFSATLPPVISQVTSPAAAVLPGQAVAVQARVQSRTPLKDVTLLYRVVLPGSLGEERSIPMTPAGAGAGGTDDRYRAEIPGQEAGRIVRFRIQAVDQAAAKRVYPAPSEPRPAFSLLVFTNVSPGRIPLGYLIHPDADEAESARRAARAAGRGGGQGPEAMGRFFAQMQFRAAADLPGLWLALTASNATPTFVEQLRPVFANHLAEREALEKKSLADAELETIAQRLPEITKPFKAALETSLKPLLNAEQLKRYEAWRDAPAPPPPMGGPGGDPAAMLRQFIPLEPAYLHLATRTNVTTAQLRDLSDIYLDAIRQRDALVPDLAKLLAGKPGENEADGQKLQMKAMAIPGAVEERLKKLLTAAQTKDFAAWQLTEQPPFGRRGGGKPPEPAQGQSAFVLVDPGTRQPRLFDFVHIPERSGGWKVHFAKGDSWNGMTAIDLVFEASERWLYSEHLAYELHRRAGLAAPRTEFVRLDVDGLPVGFHLLIEQPNKAFLRNHHLRDDGNLYKATWAGNGIEGTHEKRTNRQTGHDDLIQLVESLEKTKDQPEEQWAIIRREFDTEEVINHYAVRTLISDWDGFFNNYYLYHDLNGTRRWTFYPWDEDKTWGEYDGWEQEGPLYELPMNYAAEGDHPPGEPGGRPSTSYGFRNWWRAGGYISRPLLANPIFRRHFLARLKELLETEFTEARLNPLVEDLRTRLRDEIDFRAQLAQAPQDRVRQRFDAHLASYPDFIGKRRAWLLKQDEIKSAGPFRRSEIR